MLWTLRETQGWEDVRCVYTAHAHSGLTETLNLASHSHQGEGVQQLREALKILAERVLILEHMIGVHGESQLGLPRSYGLPPPWGC